MKKLGLWRWSSSNSCIPPVKSTTGLLFHSSEAESSGRGGSVRSLCPLHFLGDLGLSRSDLVRNEKRGSPAVGPEFDTYSAKIAINGQIMIPSPEENDFKPWDKLFSMDLVFAKTDTLLLGQSDFFRCFDISFLNGAEDEGTTLELVRCPPPARV